MFIDNYAVYKDSEYNCKLEFRIKNQCIEIKSENCTSYSGIGVYFDGIYCKGQNKNMTSENYFIELGIFNNKTELNSFKQLVGKSYNLFENSFHLIFEDEDIDYINATVFTGGVRGLYTISEGIIMKCPNGMLYAAVIDDDIVRFYSNDPKFSNSIPKTINKWRERFNEKKVLIMFHIANH